MTKYFSAATCSFYDTDVFPENNLPEDCVIVEEETYKSLMKQQNAGFVIVPDSDGNPSVMPQNCGSCHCTVHEKTVATKDQLGHVKIDGETLDLNEDGELTVVGGGGGSGRTVGEIFYTSRLDAEQNGAVKATGGIYSIADFTGKDSVPELLKNGRLHYISLEEYESIVAANGSCRFWGYDGGDTFRVPTAEKPKRVLVAKKEATATDQTWFNWYSDGWLEQGGVVANTGTNHVATISLLKPYADTNYIVTTGHENSAGARGVADVGQIGTKTISDFQSYQYTDVKINWYACGYAEIPTEAEYQFQNIEVQRAMVQVATGATDEALATCTGVLADVAELKTGKANTDLSNLDETGQAKLDAKANVAQFQVVSALPASPDANVFYFIPE